MPFGIDSKTYKAKKKQIVKTMNEASTKNAPFTYWDASRIISEDIIPLFKNGNV
ncbi:MAG: hypothetical protein ACFFA0_06725 [Promethearchaeota archaeon]